MIPVVEQNEPPNFNDDVRIPGLQFIQNNPKPRSKEYDEHAYWGKIGPNLYQLYNGICAYTGMWFSPPSSVDHFLPKSKYPKMAYEWNNYRLTTQIMNGIKGDKEGIVDPFKMQYDWFLLDLESGVIKANDNLPDDIKNKVVYTINELKLNSNDDRVQIRFNIIKEYRDGSFSSDFLHNRYPFIAYEIKRQKMQSNKI